MVLLPTTINRISDRGGIFINDTLVINSRCEVVDFPYEFNGRATDDPLVNFDTLSHKYGLDDLRIPYELSMDANCDTINVSKGNYKLKFLLEEFE